SECRAPCGRKTPAWHGRRDCRWTFADGAERVPAPIPAPTRVQRRRYLQGQRRQSAERQPPAGRAASARDRRSRCFATSSPPLIPDCSTGVDIFGAGNLLVLPTANTEREVTHARPMQVDEVVVN